MTTKPDDEPCPRIEALSALTDDALPPLARVSLEAHAAIAPVGAHGVDQPPAPQRAVFVADRRREGDRVHHGRRLEHEAAVLVALELHAVRRDRVDAVRVLRLVEQAVDEARRMQADVLPERRVAQARAHEQLRRVERAGCDDDAGRPRGVARAGGVGVLDARRLRAVGPVLDQDALDRGLRAQVELPERQRPGDVRVHRRLAGARGAALQARAVLFAVGAGV